MQYLPFQRGLIEYSNIYEHHDAYRDIAMYFAEIESCGDDEKLTAMIETYGNLALFIRSNKTSPAIMERFATRLRNKSAGIHEFYFTESAGGQMAVAGNLKVFLQQADAGAFPDLFDHNESGAATSVIQKKLLPILDKITEVIEGLKKAGG